MREETILLNRYPFFKHSLRCGQGNRKFSTIRHIDDTHYYVDLVY